MERRDLIKQGLAIAAIGALGLTGCKNEKPKKKAGFNIEPKQTGVYEFSVPMPFNFEVIDKLEELNKKYKKSQITSLYNSTPYPYAKKYNGWLQVSGKGENKNIKSFADFQKFSRYAISKGFKVCYLMNSPKPFSERDYNGFRNDFITLLDDIKQAGINEIKVANTQVATLINQERPDFKLQASTAFEYHNTQQYQNLVHNYPNINMFDIAIDENQNFKFLNSLRKIFPNIKLELMVNEPCMKGCPARISHAGAVDFCQFECSNMRNKDAIKYAFKLSSIYPWTLEYYSAIGINNFKFVADKNALRADFNDLSHLQNYLDCVEYGYENYSAKDFIYDTFSGIVNIPDYIKVSSIMPYLPDVKHFIKFGDKCAARCEAECTYCGQKAQEMKEYIKYINA